jgi:DNA-binding transcriptional MerR regulator
MQPAKAAALMGVSSRQLAHWADMGLITVLHEPGHTRRYLEQELRLVAFLIRNVRYPNAALLKRILKHGFYVN